MKVLAVVSAVTFLAGQIMAQEAASSHKVCWPLHFAGLTVGFSTDSEMRRLLGDGLFRKDEGDSGGRVFIDKGRKATLHAQCYTDNVIGDLTLSVGVDPGLSKTEQKKAVSLHFDPTEGFGNWHALHLGSTKAEVLKNLGPPENGTETNEWRYATECSCEIENGFTITFAKDHIVRIYLEAPSG